MRTRGCNGLSYILEYAKERGKSDEEVTQDGMWKEGVWDMGDVEGGLFVGPNVAGITTVPLQSRCCMPTSF